MKPNRILSLFLSLILILGIIPVTAADPVQSVTVNFSAQTSNGSFFCAPQFNVAVAADTAESYGYPDGITDGVSAADVLVKLHAIKYGSDFTQAAANTYLAFDESGFVTKLFGTATSATGFVLNGGFPNDNGTGTTVTTQPLADNDTVEFFIYADTSWGDELSWFNYKGSDVSEIKAAPNTSATLTLKSYSYLLAMFETPPPTTEQIHALGSSVSGAQLAYVNAETGALTPIDGAITDANGAAAFTTPTVDGTYYLTAYIPTDTEGEPLIMSITRLIVDKDTPVLAPNDLTALSVTTFDKNPNALELTSAFNPKTTEYTTCVADFPSVNIPVYFSAYIKASAESSDAVIKASCGDVTIDVPNPSNDWKIMLSALKPGKNNVITVTVAESSAANADTKTYTVTIPMKPQSNSAPTASVTTAAKTISLGDTYTEDLSSIFTDADEIDTLSYKVSVNGAAAVPADKSYSFAPESKGTYTLAFSANDGACDSDTYTVTLTVNDLPHMLTAAADDALWYPSSFDKSKFEYIIAVPSGVTEKNITCTIDDGAVLKIDDIVQTPDENNKYTFAIDSNQKSLTVTSKDGKIGNTYSFKLRNKLVGYPDNVTDFLCINSQYTNGLGGGNAAFPHGSLFGDYTSLGGFGGYITYYYADALTDNPNNKYGIDFYVYGNANKDISTSTKTVFFEPAQAWVSEDGEAWYALAGSAHYDTGVDTNYSITYTKTADGKTAWTDSRGNSNDGASYSGAYPLASIYYMNNLAASNSITLSGIALPAQNGSLASVGEYTDAYPVKWGYADCFENGTIGADVNPYTDNSNFDLQTNGFDLKWAVDGNGTPIDVSDKEFHYVKLVSASNIWHPSYNEKSPEISGVVKTTPQSAAVGVTDAPKSISVTDGTTTKVVSLNDTQQIYSVNIGNIKYASIAVNGAAADDNIYINNTRVASGETADGFKITAESGERLVRIVVQNGDKEPRIYLLKISGTATETNDLIEGVKLDVNGSLRAAATKNGELYSASVGYRISSVGIQPVADNDVTVKINGEAISDSYALSSGVNSFTITAQRGDITHSVTLEITRASAPASNGKITVYFTLLGDDAHGEGGTVHTLKKGGLDTWIAKTAVTIDTPATVLDVIEKALDGKYTFNNPGGNYISEIDGLGELDNGPLSGWMYTLNGKYSNSGIAEQTVKNGDNIILHYTDDYTKETNSSSFGSTSSGSTSNKNNTGTLGTVTTPDNIEPITSNGALPFGDTENHWALDAISYVYKNALMQGVNISSFAPDEDMTRAMLVTVLYRLSKAEKISADNKFSDVALDEWYTDAIIWAYENGIVYGVSENEFAPNDSITREQLAVIVYRYAEHMGYDVSTLGTLDSFKDYTSASDWATDALKWATATKLINGVGDLMLAPSALATRAQVATILMRFCEMNIK